MVLKKEIIINLIYYFFILALFAVLSIELSNYFNLNRHWTSNTDHEFTLAYNALLFNSFLKLEYIDHSGYFTIIFLSFFMSWWGGYISSYYKEPWYSELIKPSFNPPDWIFGPVWIILYLLMGFAIWLIWLNPKKIQKVFNIYFIHLIINASWSIAFFALHQILVSLIIIALIIIFVIWLIKLYQPINKISALLMLPYLAWLGFAFLLNYSIFVLN